MFDLTSYLIFPDWTGVILLNRWFDVSQWYIIYPLAMLHSCAWVLLKVYIFRGSAALVQSIAARRRASCTVRVPSTAWYRRLLRLVWKAIVRAAHAMYAGAKRLAHGKVVTAYSLFWLALTPLMQKLGDAIVGIRWQQFGRRGVYALCLGASFQTMCFCTLYSIYGEERKAEADQVMLWIMLPLGIVMLLGWMLKNGRSKSV